MSAVLSPPSLVGGRTDARALLSETSEDLTGQAVRVNFAAEAMCSPSFVDEIVKVCLVDRDAASLVMCGASARIAGVAVRAADAHGVRKQLDVG